MSGPGTEPQLHDSLQNPPLWPEWNLRLTPFSSSRFPLPPSHPLMIAHAFRLCFAQAPKNLRRRKFFSLFFRSGTPPLEQDPCQVASRCPDAACKGPASPLRPGFHVLKWAGGSIVSRIHSLRSTKMFISAQTSLSSAARMQRLTPSFPPSYPRQPLAHFLQCSK
jgi:hypothetical protein